MTREGVYFHTFGGAEITDPFYRDSKWLTNVSFSTKWGIGHAEFRAQVRRDVLDEILYGGGDQILIKAGDRILYDGELNDPEISTFGQEIIRLDGVGWINTLKRNKLRYRWFDDNGVLRLEWPKDSGDYTLTAQEIAIAEKRNDFFVWRVVVDDFSVTGDTADHYEEYLNPANNPIKRITANLRGRSGEGVRLRLYDGNGTLQYTWTPTADGNLQTTSMDVTLSPGTTIDVQFLFDTTTDDIYDQNDWISIHDMKVYGDTLFTQKDMIQRVLTLMGDYISDDYGQITSPTQTLQPFMTRNDGFQSALSLIQDILAFGDASQNSYEFLVWDGQNSSDGQPQGEVRVYNIADWEYEIDPWQDGVQVQLSPQSRDKLYNWIAVRWVDVRSSGRHLTPYDNSALKDQISIDTYGQRVLPVDVGPATETLALAIGKSLLAFNKDPKPKARFYVPDRIRNQSGAWVPVGQVRAGDRVRFKPTGDIYFIGETRYDLQRRACTMSTELPADRLSLYLKQRRFGMENTWPIQSGYLGG